MPVFISLFRGVNVGGHNKIKMDALRSLYQSLGFRNTRTYIQSGNVVFVAKERNPALLTKKIHDAMEKTFDFCPVIVLRSANELRSAIAASPFAKRKDIYSFGSCEYFAIASRARSRNRTISCKRFGSPLVCVVEG